MHSAGLISSRGCEEFSFSGNYTQREGSQPGPDSLVHNNHLSSSHLTTFASTEREIAVLQSLQVFSLSSSQNMNTGYSHRWLSPGSRESRTNSQSESGPGAACRFPALVLEWFSVSLCSVVNACLFCFWPDESKDRPFFNLSGFSLSLNMDVYTITLRRRPNEWAPPQIRIFLLAAISVHSERTAPWERRPFTGSTGVQTVTKPGWKNVQINNDFTIKWRRHFTSLCVASQKHPSGEDQPFYRRAHFYGKRGHQRRFSCRLMQIPQLNACMKGWN